MCHLIVPITVPTNSVPDMFLVTIRAVGRNKKVTAAVAIGVIAAASLTALILPPLYTSTAVLLPPSDATSPGAQLMAQLSSAGSVASLGSSVLGLKNPNDLQVALLKSRSVEDAVIRQFRLQQEYRASSLYSTRRRWRRCAAVDNGLKDGLIRVSVSDRDPQRAAELANGWVEEYRRFSATLAITEASRRREFLQAELDTARAVLTRSEEEMKLTEQRTGVIALQGQASALIASAATLRAQVTAKQVEIQAMRQFAADGNPDMQRAQQELVALQDQLGVMNVSRERSRGDLVVPRGTVAQAGLDYERAFREVKYRETVVELLSRLYEAAAVDEARQGPLIQIVDAATAADRPDSHYRLWIFLAGIFFALPVGVSTALLRELIAVLRARRKAVSSWTAVLERSWNGEGV